MSGTKLPALSTVKTFNALAKRAQDKGTEMLALAWKAGETALEAKKSLPHGEWLPFVEQHYNVHPATVAKWIRFHRQVAEDQLGTLTNMNAGLKMIEVPKTKTKEDDSGTEPDGADSEGTEAPATDDDPRPPRNGTDEPGDSSDEEPVDPLDVQRFKTINAVDDLTQEFADLNSLAPNDLHDSATKLCVAALKIAQGWR